MGILDSLSEWWDNANKPLLSAEEQTKIKSQEFKTQQSKLNKEVSKLQQQGLPLMYTAPTALRNLGYNYAAESYSGMQGEALKTVFDMAETPFRTLAETSSAAMLTAQSLRQNPSSVFMNPSKMLQLIDESRTAAQGNREDKQWFEGGADPITLGQARYGLFHDVEVQKLSLDQRVRLFDENISGKLESGSIDFLAALLLDPVNYVPAGAIGKVGKVTSKVGRAEARAIRNDMLLSQAEKIDSATPVTDAIKDYWRAQPKTAAVDKRTLSDIINETLNIKPNDRPSIFADDTTLARVEPRTAREYDPALNPESDLKNPYPENIVPKVNRTPNLEVDPATSQYRTQRFLGSLSADEREIAYILTEPRRNLVARGDREFAQFVATIEPKFTLEVPTSFSTDPTIPMGGMRYMESEGTLWGIKDNELYQFIPGGRTADIISSPTVTAGVIAGRWKRTNVLPKTVVDSITSFTPNELPNDFVSRADMPPISRDITRFERPFAQIDDADNFSWIGNVSIPTSTSGLNNIPIISATEDFIRRVDLPNRTTKQDVMSENARFIEVTIGGRRLQLAIDGKSIYHLDSYRPKPSEYKSLTDDDAVKVLEDMRVGKKTEEELTIQERTVAANYINSKDTGGGFVEAADGTRTYVPGSSLSTEDKQFIIRNSDLLSDAEKGVVKKINKNVEGNELVNPETGEIKALEEDELSEIFFDKLGHVMDNIDDEASEVSAFAGMIKEGPITPDRYGQRRAVWVSAMDFDWNSVESYTFPMRSPLTGEVIKATVPQQYRLFNAADVNATGARPLLRDTLTNTGDVFTVDLDGSIVTIPEHLAHLQIAKDVDLSTKLIMQQQAIKTQQKAALEFELNKKFRSKYTDSYAYDIDHEAMIESLTSKIKEIDPNNPNNAAEIKYLRLRIEHHKRNIDIEDNYVTQELSDGTKVSRNQTQISRERALEDLKRRDPEEYDLAMERLYGVPRQISFWFDVVKKEDGSYLTSFMRRTTETNGYGDEAINVGDPLDEVVGTWRMTRGQAEQYMTPSPSSDIFKERLGNMSNPVGVSHRHLDDFARNRFQVYSKDNFVRSTSQKEMIQLKKTIVGRKVSIENMQKNNPKGFKDASIEANIKLLAEEESRLAKLVSDYVNEDPDNIIGGDLTGRAPSAGYARRFTQTAPKLEVMIKETLDNLNAAFNTNIAIDTDAAWTVQNARELRATADRNIKLKEHVDEYNAWLANRLMVDPNYDAVPLLLEDLRRAMPDPVFVNPEGQAFTKAGPVPDKPQGADKDPFVFGKGNRPDPTKPQDVIPTDPADSARLAAMDERLASGNADIPNTVFVFGSNLQGIHGKGAALDAVKTHGAVKGQGVGIQGSSYAIPTKSTPYISLTPEQIKPYIDGFIGFAKANPNTTFNMTDIGLGLANNPPEAIANLFDEVPDNIVFITPNSRLKAAIDSKSADKETSSAFRPEGILQKALKSNPNNKKIESLLNNFKSKQYGAEENDFLDSMLAAVSVGKDGKDLYREDLSGFDTLVAALNGDEAAAATIDMQKSALYKIIDERKKIVDSARRTEAERLAAEYPNDYIKNADESQVPVIHSTTYPVVRNADGSISLFPAGHHRVGTNAEVARASVHFTLEAPVASHGEGKWDSSNIKIVSNLSSMMKNNDLPYNLNPVDTWWQASPGQPLKITDAIVIRPTKNADKNLPIISVDKKTKDVLYSLKDNYTPEDRLEIVKIATDLNETSFKVDDNLTVDITKDPELLIGYESEILDQLAMQLAKKELNINTARVEISGPNLSSKDRQAVIGGIRLKHNIPGTTHQATGLSKSEQSNGLTEGEPVTKFENGIEAMRFAALMGKFKRAEMIPTNNMLL